MGSGSGFEIITSVDLMIARTWSSFLRLRSSTASFYMMEVKSNGESEAILIEDVMPPLSMLITFAGNDVSCTRL